MLNPGQIRSLNLRYRLEVLDPDQVTKIHQGALDILERVGIATSSDRLLELMANHGQQVDFEDKRVRLAPGFVEEKRALAPRHFTLGARDPELNLELDGKHGYLSPDGCAPQILDPKTGQRRASTKADLGTVTRLADALPEIGLMWRSVAANDTPAVVRSLHEVEIQLANTTKHLQTGSGTDAFNARAIVEMLLAVTGGSEALRNRPIFSSNQCILSPLFWDADPLEAFEVYAEAGIPISIISMAMTCATTPGTVAGAVVLTIAEILSGVTILQTMSPGAKAICTAYPATIDLNSGALNLAAGPDDATAGMACTQVLRHLGLPCGTGILGTGAKTSNWQAGVQSTLTAVKSAAMSADVLNGAGGIYGSSVYSPIQLVLDCEVFDIVARWTEACAIDDEHMALDLIEEVGPAGHFLAAPHTLTHMRELWRSRFMDTSSWEEWQEAGEPDSTRAAEAEAKMILDRHEPDPLPEDIATEIRRIVERHQAEALEQEV